MRAVIQRVSQASVTVDGVVIGAIQHGLMILLGAGQGDTETDLDYVLEKSLNLRIFSDENEKMNFSLLDIEGDLLVVSQFTLYGDIRKGRRPSFVGAMEPNAASEMIDLFVQKAQARGVHVETGQFGANMSVELTNQGPVTIIIDSKN